MPYILEYTMLLLSTKKTYAKKVSSFAPVAPACRSKVKRIILFYLYMYMAFVWGVGVV